MKWMVAGLLVTWSTVLIGQEGGSDLVITPSFPAMVEGVPNLFKINDSLYRSGQPSTDGYRNLDSMGVKSILILKPGGKRRAEKAGIKHVIRIPLRAARPKKEKVEACYRILCTAPKPMLIHCRAGADRTGLVVGIFRILSQGWNKDQALDELVGGPFGFHKMYRKIPSFIRNL